MGKLAQGELSWKVLLFGTEEDMVLVLGTEEDMSELPTQPELELQPRSGLGPGGHLAQGPGRVDLPRSVPGPGGQGDLCLVRLEPCTSDQSLYCVRLATNIPTFQLKTSCTFR